MEYPLVSIVIPVYNRPKEIVRAVNSVTSQSYRNLEVVVVDDASIDNTAEVVRKLAAKDPRVKLISASSNGGSQRAANIGIRAAQGEWVGFLDSDDWYLEGSVALRMEQVLREEADCAHSAYILREQNGRERVLNLPELSGHIYRAVLSRPGPMYQSLLTRKSALLRIGLRDESILTYQEWDTAISLAKYYTFTYVPIPTYVYDCTTPVTLSKSRRNDAIGYEQVVFKHQSEIVREARPGAMYTHYCETLSRYRSIGGLSAIWSCCRRWIARVDSPYMICRFIMCALTHSARECLRHWMPPIWKRALKRTVKN